MAKGDAVSVFLQESGAGDKSARPASGVEWCITSVTANRNVSASSGMTPQFSSAINGGSASGFYYPIWGSGSNDSAQWIQDMVTFERATCRLYMNNDDYLILNQWVAGQGGAFYSGIVSKE